MSDTGNDRLSRTEREELSALQPQILSDMPERDFRRYVYLKQKERGCERESSD